MSEHALKPWDRERHSDPGPFVNHSGNVKKKKKKKTLLVNKRFRLDNVAVISFQIYNDSFKVCRTMHQKSLVILCDGSVRYFCLTFFSATTLKDGNGSNVIYFYYKGSHF